ncbi:hypothetical protein FM038_014085 [Shewanella eurypsychrophilus]|uniref:NrS-1 polymerase-like helicase domain-containing protein n=1 Tax=Shewanella eurypsychrophilus TaxID=2593656 RepID=A0ABX6V742_9GAMM|nr:MULTISPECIES: DUF5906 domain-containing protein [Shewanella]QFU23164.1 hypothetical protein FS418_15665 [Shewanella sp. YLB-09]QPG58447.1 hypothetical protein FM038_014085 [Shewanella eurypsychrophilus]
MGVAQNNIELSEEEQLLNKLSDAIQQSQGADPIAICEGVLGDWRYVFEDQKFLNIKTGIKRNKENFTDTFRDKLPVSTRDDGSVQYGSPVIAFLHGKFFDGIRGDFTEMDSTRPTGDVVDRHGFSMLNSYIDRGVQGVQGDVSRFLDLLDKLFKTEQDKTLILQTMNWIITHRGDPKNRLNFCPVIIGIEGNGKTTIVNIIKRAIGEEYFISPMASDLDSQFNGYIQNKILCNFDELKEAQCNTIAEKLKPWITNDTISIRKMNTDTFSATNTTNFIITTNNVNALMQHKGNTRFCNFLTTHQQNDMDAFNAMFGGEEAKGDYYDDLYQWLDNGGYENCIHYILNSVDMTGFSGRRRAPKTSVHDEFLNQQKSNNDLKIEECLEDMPVFTTEQFADKWKANGYGNAPSPKVLGSALERMDYWKSPQGKRGHRITLASGESATVYHPKTFSIDKVKIVYACSDVTYSQSNDPKDKTDELTSELIGGLKK